MSHKPNGLNCEQYALDEVTNPMDGYLKNATDAINSWEGKSTTTPGAMLAAAYLIGCALLHAVLWLVEASKKNAAWVRDGLESNASAINQVALKAAEQASALAAQAEATVHAGEAVSTAIEAHSESTDRLADAIEARAP